MTFRQERKNKEDEETMAGEITGSAGDKSPLDGGSGVVRPGYLFVAQTASGFSGKVVVSVRGAVSGTLYNQQPGYGKEVLKPKAVMQLMRSNQA